MGVEVGIVLTALIVPIASDLLEANLPHQPAHIAIAKWKHIQVEGASITEGIAKAR